MRSPDLEATWQALAGEVFSGFRAWRAAHPTATLTEIEQALDDRWMRARAQVVEDAAVLSAAAALNRTSARPACPRCGTRMQADGTEGRRLTTDGDHPLTLRRSHARCPACGSGLFPPG